MAKKTPAAHPKKKADPAALPFFRPFAELGSKKKKKADSPAAPAAPAAPPRPAPRPAEAPLDARSFAIYMAGVRALPGRAARVPENAGHLESAPRGPPAYDDADDSALVRLRSLVTEGVRFETTDDGERLEGRRLDVDPRELRRLRRGEHAIDGKLDLHGLGVDDARGAVEVFVKKRATDGDLVVVIVPGKGTHSPRQSGVLRGEIGAWLSQGRAARHVRAFTTAPEEDGGTGALLVLLAR